MKDDEIFIYFVHDKFTGDLQPFVLPGFTFLFIKIMHYFSFVIRNVPRPDRFTKIKFPRATSPAAKLRQQHLHFLFHSLLHDLHYSVLHVRSSKAPLHSCQQQSTSYSQFSSQVFSHDIFFYPLWLLGFQLHSPLVCLSGSCFLHALFPSFSWSSFSERSYYFKEQFHKCS
jgi:hypothetical protein